MWLAWLLSSWAWAIPHNSGKIIKRAHKYLSNDSKKIRKKGIKQFCINIFLLHCVLIVFVLLLVLFCVAWGSSR